MPENLSDFIEIYEDEALTKKIECFNFGEAEIGKTTEKIFYLKNFTKGFIEVFEAWFENNTATIVKFPKMFAPGEVHPLVVEVSPPLGIDEGLKDQIMFKLKQTFRP